RAGFFVIRSRCAQVSDRTVTVKRGSVLVREGPRFDPRPVNSLLFTGQDEMNRSIRSAVVFGGAERAASLGLVEGQAEAEKRQAHLDRLLAGVLDGDLQVAARAEGGEWPCGP